MNKLHPVFCVIAVLILSASPCIGQISLTIDDQQSSVDLDLAGSSDSSTLSGSMDMLLTPPSEPFGTAQMTDLSLILDDGFSFNILGGLVSATASPGDVILVLDTPGPAGNVNGSNMFDQLGNIASYTGNVQVNDPFNLFGGSRTVDLSTVDPTNFDMTGVQLSVSGNILTVTANVVLTVPVDPVELDVDATVVATGVLPPPAFDATPDAYILNAGVLSSGDVSNLQASDNSDLSLSRNPFQISSIVEFECKGNSSDPAPTSLTFRLESSVFARSTVTQTIWLYDYDTDTWEIVDSRNAARFADQTVDVAAAGDLSRFVEPGTGCIEARIRYRSLVARQNFSANVDHVLWMFNQ
ncbi:MAG: hypothetical protein AAF456_20800 [Planctomycetota bacterium]